MCVHSTTKEIVLMDDDIDLSQKEQERIQGNARKWKEKVCDEVKEIAVP